MDDPFSASVFCFTPLRVPVSELGRRDACPPSQPSPIAPACSTPPLSELGRPDACPPSQPSSSLGQALGGMDCQRLPVSVRTGSSLEPIDLVDDLRQEVDQLRAKVRRLEREVQRLERENLEERQQAAYWKSRHRDALLRITDWEKKVEQLEGEKRKLQADLFGKSTEKTTRSDRSNDLDDPQDDSRRPPQKRGQQPNNPGPKRRDYSHLPVEHECSVRPAEECVCPECGEPLLLRGDTEDSEQIEIEVRAYRRVIHRRRYQRTCTCEGPLTLSAPPTPKLIPKGRYGISVWVEIVLDKYFSFRPTERLLASWRLLGLDLAPGTVTDGLRRLEVLLKPIYEALQKRNRQGDLHQADETRWPVFIILEGKEGYGWWLWVYLSHDTVVFLLSPGRDHTVPENHFRAESRGVCVVDRYSAYKAMSWVKDGVLVLAFCWAHVRRDFVRVGKGWPQLKTWALEWLRRIRELYRLNRRRLAVKRDSAEFKEADNCLRQAVAQIKKQMEAELARADLATPCRKVLESLREHWVGLTRFVDDPRIPMDNNASERCGRGPAIARKNFYGSGSQWSGELAAASFSIFATLSMGKLNPRKWLTWYFKECAAAGGKVPADIQRFLPWNLSEEKKKELSDNKLSKRDDTS
jgi:transposase